MMSGNRSCSATLRMGNDKGVSMEKLLPVIVLFFAVPVSAMERGDRSMLADNDPVVVVRGCGGRSEH